MKNELRFHVRVAPELIDVNVLTRSIGAFAALVNAAGSGRWVVSDLRLASVTAAARPVALSDAEVDVEFERLASGLLTLVDGPATPPGWDDDLMQSVADLHSVLDTHGVEGLELTFGDRAPIGVDTAAVLNAKSALDARPLTLGAVTGKVDRFLSRDSRRELGLVDEATGDKVTVRFSRDWEDEAPTWIGRRVTAWGMLRRTAHGRKKELQMEGIEVAPALETTSVADVLGILGADWTGGMSSVEWVRGQRGED